MQSHAECRAMLNFATWPQIDGRDNPLLRSPGDMSRLAEASFAHRLELHSLTTVSLKTAPSHNGSAHNSPWRRSAELRARRRSPAGDSACRRPAASDVPRLRVVQRLAAE